MNKVMNKLFSVAIIINFLFTFLLIGCSRQPSATSNNSQESTKSENKELLLEIYTKYEGMMHPKGTLLEIRLYSTGDAEFDYFLPSRMDHKPNEITRKDARLEKETVQQIKTLIEAPDFISAKGFYPPSIPLSDASTTTTITFKRQQEEKKIVLEETDTTLHLDKKDKVYPKSVIMLLRVIENLRTKFESQSL